MVPVMATACAFCVATIYYNQPLLPQMAASFGRPETGAGVIATCTQLGYAAGLLLFVPLGDQIDRKRLLLTLLSFNTASLMVATLAPHFIAFAVANLAIGMTAVGAQIIIPAISGLVEPERRGRTLGALMSGMSAGLLFARALSGVVGAHAGWRTMYGLAIVFDVILMLAVAFRMPRDPVRATLSYPALLSSLWPLVKQEAGLRSACLSGFLMFAAFSAVWSTLATLLARAPFHFGPDIVGSFGLVGMAGLFASSPIGRAVDTLSAYRVLTAGALTVLLSSVLLGQAGWSLPALVIALVLIDIGNRAGMISNQNRIYAKSDNCRSRRNTVFMTCYFLGGATGSAVGAAAVEYSGWSGLSLTGMFLSLSVLVVHRWAARYDRSSAQVDSEAGRKA